MANEVWDNRKLQEAIERDKLLRRYESRDPPPEGEQPKHEDIKVSVEYSAERDRTLFRVEKDGNVVESDASPDISLGASNALIKMMVRRDDEWWQKLQTNLTGIFNQAGWA